MEGGWWVEEWLGVHSHTGKGFISLLGARGPTRRESGDKELWNREATPAPPRPNPTSARPAPTWYLFGPELQRLLPGLLKVFLLADVGLGGGAEAHQSGECRPPGWAPGKSRPHNSPQMEVLPWEGEAPGRREGTPIFPGATTVGGRTGQAWPWAATFANTDLKVKGFP